MRVEAVQHTILDIAGLLGPCQTTGDLPGAAAHYHRGRPPYSPELGSLAGELSLNGTVRLLDAGGGAGMLTVLRAPLFAETVGLDPDPDMLTERRRAAEEQRKDLDSGVTRLSDQVYGDWPGFRVRVRVARGDHQPDEPHL